MGHLQYELHIISTDYDVKKQYDQKFQMLSKPWRAAGYVRVILNLLSSGYKHPRILDV